MGKFQIHYRMLSWMIAALFVTGCVLPHAVQAQVAAVREFMEEPLECDRYVFNPGDFPTFHWKHERRVEQLVGQIPLSVTYYNAGFERVTTAAHPGRYGAVIEGRTPSGFIVRRYVTLFCSDVEFDDYSRNVPVRMNELAGYRITKKNWERYAANEERFSFGSLKYFPQRDPDAAVFLAGLNELDERSGLDDTPRIRDRQWWITLKQKISPAPASAHMLRTPKVAGAPLLRPVSSGAASRYDRKQIDSLRAFCRMWAEKSGAAHVALVLHKGQIIFHEAFGRGEDGTPVTIRSRMWMASITKLLTGMLMMQCVDQGLVDLDAPVGTYLPELAGTAGEKLTVRHLFTHTSGLSFAGEWASDWNQALENQVTQVLPTAEIGAEFSYHRIGYALAGRMIERLTGRAVPYLFHDQLFAPLGMGTAYSDNTYGGLYCTAADLARLGAMLLHKGTFGGCVLFSPRSFEQMLPAPLPVGNRRWGIGTSAMGGHGLSDSAFGHSAASGSVFRIDLANDLVIISARNSSGRSHREFERAFIGRCSALVRSER